MNLHQAELVMTVLEVVGLPMIGLGTICQSTGLMYAGSAVLLLSVLVAVLFKRCPHCKKALHWDADAYCPHCGKEL